MNFGRKYSWNILERLASPVIRDKTGMTTWANPFLQWSCSQEEIKYVNFIWKDRNYMMEKFRVNDGDPTYIGTFSFPCDESNVKRLSR